MLNDIWCDASKGFERNSAGGKEAPVALCAWWGRTVKKSKKRKAQGKGVSDGVGAAAA